MHTTTKSSRLNVSRRYACSPRTNPSAMIFASASSANATVKKSLMTSTRYSGPGARGTSSTNVITVDIAIATMMNRSNRSLLTVSQHFLLNALEGGMKNSAYPCGPETLGSSARATWFSSAVSAWLSSIWMNRRIQGNRIHRDRERQVRERDDHDGDAQRRHRAHGPLAPDAELEEVPEDEDDDVDVARELLGVVERSLPARLRLGRQEGDAHQHRHHQQRLRDRKHDQDLQQDDHELLAHVDDVPVHPLGPAVAVQQTELLLEPIDLVERLGVGALDDGAHAREHAGLRPAHAVPAHEPVPEHEHPERVHDEAQHAQEEVLLVGARVALHGGVRAEAKLPVVIALAIEKRDGLLREEEVSPLEQQHHRRLRRLERLREVLPRRYENESPASPSSSPTSWPLSFAKSTLRS